MSSKNNNTFIDNHGLPKFSFNLGIFHSDDAVYNREALVKAMNDDFIVLDLKSVKSFIADIDKEAAKLEKAESAELFQKAADEMLTLKMITVVNKDGSRENLFIRKKATPVEDLAKAADEDDIQKGIVTDAFRYSSKILLEKTGAQIKEKAKEAIKDEEATATTLSGELDAMLEETEKLPTDSISEWNYRGYKKKIGVIPYKRYDWSMTYYDENNANNGAKFIMETKASNGGKNYACSQEEADACRKYNDTLEKYTDAKVEIASLQFIVDNLEDKKKYELSQEQATALNF